MPYIARLRSFVIGMTRLVERHGADEPHIHVVSNAGPKTAVSIHVYGANIGAVRRHRFEPATAQPKEFVSGYHNSTLPNLWDRSKD